MQGTPARSELRDRVLVRYVSSFSGEVVWEERMFAFGRVGDAISKANGSRRHGGEGRWKRDIEFRLVDDMLGRHQIAEMITRGQHSVHVQVVAVPPTIVFTPEPQAPPI